MKKCKYCQSEIDEKAKVCPVCKKRLNSGAFAVRIIIGVFIIFIGLACIAGAFNEETETSNENSQEQKYATLEKLIED